jgi:O-antigen ligase
MNRNVPIRSIIRSSHRGQIGDSSGGSVTGTTSRGAAAIGRLSYCEGQRTPYTCTYHIGIARRGDAMGAPTGEWLRQLIEFACLRRTMTDFLNHGSGCRMIGFSRCGRFDRSSFAKLADWAAVAVAMALPWSTSAVGIAIAVWLLLLLPTLDAKSVKRELATAAGGLPVALWCLGVIGMLWANVSWHDRFAGLDSFNRLLAIPLLLAQFRRSDNSIWVVRGFFLSSATVLIASYATILIFDHSWGRTSGVPVHDSVFQGSLFLICGFGAIGYAALARRKEDGWWPIAIFATGLLFLINFAFVTFSRIALAIAPLLFLLLGWRLFRWKGVLIALLLAVVAGIAMWFGSPVLRDRVVQTVVEMREYRAANKATSIGEHIAFLKESLAIIASAPMIGHGTGSITEAFQRITAGKTGVSGELTVNPHNQTFAVAIQLGLLGVVALWAMWIGHLALFTGRRSVVAWLGLVAVVEHILSSTVHSHLFDFNNGWLYVFAVGVLGGTILREPANVLKKRESAPN